MMAKRNPSLVTTFALLSCGYLLSSYHEVGYHDVIAFVFPVYTRNFFHVVERSVLFFFPEPVVLFCFGQVKSVVLRTLNRARLAVAIDSFLKTG